MLVESCDRTLLYDTGPRYSAPADAGNRVVLPYLRWRGIDRIDLLVVSHLDTDQSGGAASILGGVRLDAVLTSIDPAPRSLAASAAVIRCEAGRRFAIGDLQADVLRPNAADYDRALLASDAASCVLRVALCPHWLLLTGDLPWREEAELVSRLASQDGALKVAWLSVLHYGSRSSSSEALLAAARPRWASVPAAHRSRFGHPDPEVRERYVARGVHVVRIDESGASQWRFRSDGTVDLHRWRADAHRYWHNRPGFGAAAIEPAAEVDGLAAPGAALAEPSAPF